jgi:hypothetical protein
VTAGPAGHHAAAGHHASAGHHTAAGRGCLRASHADREHVIDVLKAAFVQGRLTKDELEARAGQTFAARTYADLAALTADLPAGLTVARAARRPARAPAPPPVTKAVLACAGAATAPALTLIAIATDSESLAKWVFLVAVVYIVAWLAAGAQMLDTWYRRRSRGQLPPRRVRRGRALDGGQDGATGGDLTACAARADPAARRPSGHGVSRPARRSLPVRRDRRRPAGLRVTT